MYKDLNISDRVVSLVNKCERELRDEFLKRDEICLENTINVLTAFKNNEISSLHFNGTNGYGFNDIGREKIDAVFRDVLKAEDALVRGQFVSGTHALTVCLFALLRPGDVMLSITGAPYDTLHEVIGIRENKSSLKAFGIGYEQVDLLNDTFDVDKIISVLKGNANIKLIEIQRSKGYSTRKSILISDIEKIVKEIRKVREDVIIMVDNCYCEFVEKTSPLEVGADIIVGSLIKNLGAGIAPFGGYIAGRKDLVLLAAERLAIPGEGKDIGATLEINRSFLQGLYMAPSAINSSVKVAILTSKVMEELGYKSIPRFDDDRCDIVQAIVFNDKDKMIRYTEGIQKGSAIDSYVSPIPDDMPGYDDKIIMAAGTFVQGATIELSCDAPLKAPYVCYQQGSLTYEYGKLGVMIAINHLLQEKKE